MRKGICSSTYPTNFHELAEKIKGHSCEDVIMDLPEAFDFHQEISHALIQTMTKPVEESHTHYERLSKLYATRIQQRVPDNEILEIVNDYAEYTHYKKLCRFYTNNLNKIIEATKQRKEAAAKGGEARSNKSKAFAKFIRDLIESKRPDQGWDSVQQFIEVNLNVIKEENSIRNYNLAPSNLSKTVKKWIDSGIPLVELKEAFLANQRQSE